MDFIKHRKIFYWFSAIIVGISIFSIGFFGFKTGIDFAGGTLWEIDFVSSSPSSKELLDFFKQYDLESKIQRGEGQIVILRFRNIDEEQHQQVLAALQKKHPSLQERRFESVGPIIGKELQKKAKWAIILVFLSILFYLAWSFRKFSHKINSWKYGSCAILALFHDAFLVAGVFSIFGWWKNWEINADFLVALLVVIGYSVNNTIVVFARLRENLQWQTKTDIYQLINQSINQTLRRSLYTSLTTLFPLVVLYFFGPLAIKTLIVAMMIGVVVGTYSSIFLAGPLIFDWQRVPLRKLR